MKTKFIQFFIFSMFILINIQTNAQIKINKDVKNEVIDFSRTYKGILLPHLNYQQRKTINFTKPCAEKGLVGYDTIEKKIYMLVHPLTVNNVIIPEEKTKNEKIDSCGCWVSFTSIEDIKNFKNAAKNKIAKLNKEINNNSKKIETLINTKDWKKAGESGNGYFFPNWGNVYNNQFQLMFKKDNSNKMYINGFIKYYHQYGIVYNHPDTILILPKAYWPKKIIHFNIYRFNNFIEYSCRYYNYYNTLVKNGAIYGFINPSGYLGVLDFKKFYNQYCNPSSEIHYFVIENVEFFLE